MEGIQQLAPQAKVINYSRVARPHGSDAALTIQVGRAAASWEHALCDWGMPSSPQPGWGVGN